MTRTARPDALARAKARLDTLDLYPEPVRIEGVSVVVTPRLFRLLDVVCRLVGTRHRFSGAAGARLILMREADYHEDLLVHELCHVWQCQHEHARTWKTYFSYPYDVNPYEVEARWAVEMTRPRPSLVLHSEGE